MRGVRDFVKGVTTLGQSNELLALHCLQKAANEEEMHEPWSSIQDPLVSLLTTMVNKTKEIRDIAADVADMYGRYNPDKFREVWEKFKNLQSL